MPDRPSLLKRSAGEELFKAQAGVHRFERDVWDKIEAVVYSQFTAIARQAGERAQSQGRTVLDTGDIFSLGTGGGIGSLTPDGLFESLQSLPTEDVVKFTRLLEAWVKEQKERPK